MARAVAVEPARPGRKCRNPTAPTQTMAADADARINDLMAGPSAISVSIFTGFPAA
jgi:hypothetical protein